MDSASGSTLECVAESGCSIPFYRWWSLIARHWSNNPRNRSVDVVATHVDEDVLAIDFVGGRIVAERLD